MKREEEKTFMDHLAPNDNIISLHPPWMKGMKEIKLNPVVVCKLRNYYCIFQGDTRNKRESKYIYTKQTYQVLCARNSTLPRAPVSLLIGAQVSIVVLSDGHQHSFVNLESKSKVSQTRSLGAQDRK